MRRVTICLALVCLVGGVAAAQVIPDCPTEIQQCPGEGSPNNKCIYQPCPNMGCQTVTIGQACRLASGVLIGCGQGQTLQLYECCCVQRRFPYCRIPCEPLDSATDTSPVLLEDYEPLECAGWCNCDDDPDGEARHATYTCVDTETGAVALAFLSGKDGKEPVRLSQCQSKR